MRKVRAILAAIVALSLLQTLAPVVAAVQDPFCSDVQLIWARGSDHDPGDDQFAFVNAELQDRLGAGVSYQVYELGADGGFGGYQYPAIGQGLDLIFEYTDIVAGEYAASVAEGRSELEAWLTHRYVECPGELYVLSGWSQGAQVIRETLFNLDEPVRNQIAYVALFGDPTFSATNSHPHDACYEQPGPWFRGTALCLSAGIFGRANPYLPDDMENRVGSWCRDGDVSCTGLQIYVVDITPHEEYFLEDGDVAMAMAEAASSLQDFLPGQANDIDVSLLQFATGTAAADMVFIFDTTGSMGGEIADAKAQATNLANLWLSVSTNGRVALVEFRDQGDPFVARVVQELTDDAGAFQAGVNSLSAQGGGDTPEAQLSGVMTALDELDWANGATKVGVVITDALGKDPEPITGYTREGVAQHALEIDPVAIYGVNVGTLQGVSDWMQPMADQTAGEVFTLGPGQTLSDLLADVIDTVAFSPVASLGGPYFAETGSPVHFHADRSFDPDGALVSFAWDFDGDGSSDQTTSDASVNHTYPGNYAGFAAVRVVSTDGGEALATAQVTVDPQGLADDVPLAPTAVDAEVTGAGEVTVSWTPAGGDRADGYKVTAVDNRLTRFVEAGGSNAVVITGLDLSEARTFTVRAHNGFGDSDEVAAAPVGGGSAWSSPTRINDDTGTTAQIQPAIAIGSDGAAHAVWRDSRVGNPDIYYARRDPTTGSWSANQRVNDVTTGEQAEPGIAVDAAGNAYAVWTDTRNGATDHDIYFSKRSASTGSWSASVRVNDDGAGKRQDFPSIAVTPSGAAVAVWRDQRGGGNKKNIYSARLPAGSSTWSANLKVTTESNAHKEGPRVALGSDATAYAIWPDQRNSGNQDVWFASLASGASVWSANLQISESPNGGKEAPAIGVDTAGNLVAVWDSGSIKARRRPAGISTWDPVVTVGGSNVNLPSVAVRGDGRAFIAWFQGTPSTLTTLYESEFDPGAGAWTSPALLTDPAVEAGTPAVAVDSSQVIVVYHGRPAGGDYDIYAKRKGL